MLPQWWWLTRGAQMWDLRKAGATTLTLTGHEDTITGLALSPDGNYLLSNAMDNTVRSSSSSVSLVFYCLLPLVSDLAAGYGMSGPSPSVIETSRLSRAPWSSSLLPPFSLYRSLFFLHSLRFYLSRKAAQL